MPYFFDSGASIGISRSPHPHSFTDVGGLIGKMDSYGIKKAMVYHLVARESNAAEGNKLLMDEIKGHDALYPVWAVMPHHTGEFDHPEKLVMRMKESGIKAVRMFPDRGYHNFNIAKRNCGELFSVLENCGVPVFLELDTDFVDWDSIDNACGYHPNLKLVLCGLDYSVDRNLYPILSLHKNVYLETYRYKTHYGIEEISLKFGASRLVFGSGMPLFSGAAAVSMINYAHISDNEKEMIAYGNLESILQEVRL